MEREYTNLSDFLFEHADQLRELYRGTAPEAYVPAYVDIIPEIDLLLAVMDAVRELPGLDTPPDGPSRFDRDIDRAVAAYRKQRDAALPLPQQIG